MKIKKINGKFKGTLSLEGIEFGKIRTAIVSPNNKTSGKINFPRDDIGKMVYIMYPEGGNRK